MRKLNHIIILLMIDDLSKMPEVKESLELLRTVHKKVFWENEYPDQNSSNTPITINTENTLFTPLFMHLSKEFPGLKFTAEYFFECENYSVGQIIELSNEELNHIGCVPFYDWGPDCDLTKNSSLNDLKQKAEAYFRTIDSEIQTESGEWDIDFVSDKVIFTVENDQYKIVCSKCYHFISIVKCFKKELDSTWTKISL